jgi:hypothetical protein
MPLPVHTLAGLAVACSMLAAYPAHALFGGAPVATNDPVHAQVVQLRTRKGDASSTCLGFVVAPRMIVTAAHCLHRAPANIRTLPGPEKQAARLAAPPVQPGDISVHYRHAGKWRVAEGFLALKQHDAAVIFMRTDHPAGYRIPALDRRTPAELVAEAIAAPLPLTFIGQGEPVAPAKGGRAVRPLVKLDGVAKRMIVNQRTGGLLVEQSTNAGTCFGDSGGAVYSRGADGVAPQLVGLLLGGQFGRYAITDSNAKCSRVQHFITMHEVDRLVDRMLHPAE